MTDDQPPEKATEAVAEATYSWAHRCAVCKGGAMFGVNTRRGVYWFCAEHRARGQKHLLPPARRV